MNEVRDMRLHMMKPDNNNYGKKDQLCREEEEKIEHVLRNL